MMETGKILILNASSQVDQAIRHIVKEICDTSLRTQSHLDIGLNHKSAVDSFTEKLSPDN